ncbi:MAG: hypothetical protein AAFW46_14450 [Pseudomonadota bacterium]
MEQSERVTLVHDVGANTRWLLGGLLAGALVGAALALLVYLRLPGDEAYEAALAIGVVVLATLGFAHWAGFSFVSRLERIDDAIEVRVAALGARPARHPISAIKRVERVGDPTAHDPECSERIVLRVEGRRRYHIDPASPGCQVEALLALDPAAGRLG